MTFRPGADRKAPELRINLNPKLSRHGSPDPRSKKMKYDEGYHFITMVTNKRVEAFKYKDTAFIAINTILFYEKRGDLNLKGYIIMPDHVHMICEFMGSGRSPDLPAIIRDIKKHIAKEVIARLASLDKSMLLNIRLPRPRKRRHTYQLWQPGHYDLIFLRRAS